MSSVGPYFPFRHAQRWAELLPNARLVEVPDSYTYVSLDQPDFLAREINAFRQYRVQTDLRPINTHGPAEKLRAHPQ